MERDKFKFLTRVGAMNLAGREWSRQRRGVRQCSAALDGAAPKAPESSSVSSLSGSASALRRTSTTANGPTKCAAGIRSAESLLLFSGFLRFDAVNQRIGKWLGWWWMAT